MARARAPLAAAVLLALFGATDPAAAQLPGVAGDSGPTVRLSGFVAGSLRDGPDGLGVAEDVLSASARLTLPRQVALQPWIQVGMFQRPDLACITVPCNVDGWTALAGVALPLSADDTGPGVHTYLLGGLGWAFSEEDEFSYLYGIGTAVALTPRLAPSLEVRWETLPGIRNVVMVNLGLRLDLF